MQANPCARQITSSQSARLLGRPAPFGAAEQIALRAATLRAAAACSTAADGMLRHYAPLPDLLHPSPPQISSPPPIQTATPKQHRRHGRDAHAPRDPQGPPRLGHRDRDAARPQRRRDPVRLARQDRHRVEARPLGDQLRPGAQGAQGPLALCAGRRDLVRRPVRAVRLVGRHAAPVGPAAGHDDAPLRRPRQGRALGRVQRRQPPDRVGVARQDDQAVEHARRVQVHDRRARGPFGVGLVRALLADDVQPDHRQRRLGQARQGLQPVQLQAQVQPRGPQRVHQHGDRLARRLAVRVGRQGARGARAAVWGTLFGGTLFLGLSFFGDSAFCASCAWWGAGGGGFL